MSLYPEQTCLLCDLPWKNNRVRYEKSLEYPAPREIMIGRSKICLEKSGLLRWGEECADTGFPANDCTIAMDALHKLIYFASENKMTAYDLRKKQMAFCFEMQGIAGPPLLFEWLQPDGSIFPALGFSDGAEHYAVLNRMTGHRIWCAQILGRPIDGTAHAGGYLYLTLEGTPFQVMCLEADTGDVVWWNRGTEEALSAEICDGTYRVFGKSGTWHRFSLIDGEKAK